MILSDPKIVGILIFFHLSVPLNLIFFVDIYGV